MEDTILILLRWTLVWTWYRLLAPERRTDVLGVNLGKNKTSEDKVGVNLIKYCRPCTLLAATRCTIESAQAFLHIPKPFFAWTPHSHALALTPGPNF